MVIILLVKVKLRSITNMSKYIKAYWVAYRKPTSVSKRRLALDKVSQWDYHTAVWNHCNVQNIDTVPDYHVMEFRDVLMVHGWDIQIVLGYACNEESCDYHSAKGEVGAKCPYTLCRGKLQLSSVPAPHYESFCNQCDCYVAICGVCGNGACNGGFGEVDGEKCLDCITAYSFRYTDDGRVIIPEEYAKYSDNS